MVAQREIGLLRCRYCRPVCTWLLVHASILETVLLNTAVVILIIFHSTCYAEHANQIVFIKINEDVIAYIVFCVWDVNGQITHQCA